MLLVKTSQDENEILNELKKHFSENIATDMMRAVSRNGMSAYGKFMVRKSGREYLLLKLPEPSPSLRDTSPEGRGKEEEKGDTEC